MNWNGKLACARCDDEEATVLASDADNYGVPVCLRCEANCPKSREFAPLPDLAALRRDGEKLTKVRALVLEWQASEDPLADAGLAMTTLAEALDSGAFK